MRSWSRRRRYEPPFSFRFRLTCSSSPPSFPSPPSTVTLIFLNRTFSQKTILGCGACCGFCACGKCLTPDVCSDGDQCTKESLNGACCSSPAPFCFPPNKCKTSTCNSANGMHKVFYFVCHRLFFLAFFLTGVFSSQANVLNQTLYVQPSPANNPVVIQILDVFIQTCVLLWTLAHQGRAPITVMRMIRRRRSVFFFPARR